MKRTPIPLVAVVLLLFLVLPVDTFAGPPGGPPAGSDYSLTEIVVGFKPGVTPPGMAVVHSQAGGRAKHDIPALKAQVVTVPAGTVGNSIRRYASHPLVAYAEPNYIAKALGEPDDLYFDRQWGMHKVKAPAAWDVTTGSSDVVIAILDTGVDPDHPDLADKIVKNVVFSNSVTSADIQGHGTHVAGIAAAVTNNAIGVAGMGYDSSIMNVKVLSDSGGGYYSWIAAGITWAADNGAHVINMSLGGTSSSQLLEDAVNYAWEKGVVVVAAAGNTGTSGPVYPAYYANCVAVAATDSYDSLASWSTFGDWVDVAAPGDSIYSTTTGGRYGRKSGTSMAAPHVAGLAALLFTTVTDANADGLLNDDIRSRIEATCDDIGVEGIGAGRINAARAVGAYGSEPEPEPGVQIALSAEPTRVSEAGTEVTYTYTVSNEGNMTLTGITVYDVYLYAYITTDDHQLAPGASTTGTAIYTVSQDDIDAGDDIVSTATVTCDQDVTDSDSANVTIEQQSDVKITVAADPTSVSEAGGIITYTYTVTNTGKTTLTGITGEDDRLGDITLEDDELAPGASTTGTATYAVTQDDIDADNDIISTATVSTTQGVTDSDTATVTVAQDGAVKLTLFAHPPSVSEAGEVSTYNYTVTNTGKVTLTGIVVDDDRLGNISLTTTTLAPGDYTDGTATYTVTQADIDAGDDIVSTATVTTDQGLTHSDSTTVTIGQQTDVQITLTSDPPTVSEAGTVISYSYTVTNTGSVSLTSIMVTDDLMGSVALAHTTLVPGASTIGWATYTVSQADIDSGEDIVNTATVTTDQGVTDSASAMVSPVQQPGVHIALAADPTSISEAGTTVTYTCIVTNQGNVTLTGIVVTDDLLGQILLDDELAPSASISGTATYTVTQADIDSGADIVNTAIVTTSEGVTDSGSATVTIEQQTSVDITITADPISVSEAGEVITYTYTVSNTGKVTLTGIVVDDDKLGSITVGSDTLGPGASSTATATCTVTQADIDAGAPIVNTATVTTSQGVTDSDSATVTVDESEIAMVTLTPTNCSGQAWAGESVVYEFTVRNAGNVPDTYDVSLSSGWTSSAVPQGLALEPEASVTIKVTHTVPEGVSPGQLDAGSVSVLSAETGASASATFTTSARVAAVEITPREQRATAAPGEKVEYIYTISNFGSDDEVYDLAVSANWEASPNRTSILVQAGTKTEVIVTHTVPNGAADSTSDRGTLKATSEKASASATFVTTAEEEDPIVPVIDKFEVTDRSNPVWAWVNVDWAVSSELGNLATVEIVLVMNDKIVDSLIFTVEGYEADGKDHLRARNGHGYNYKIILTVTDTDGNTSSMTEEVLLGAAKNSRGSTTAR